MGWTIWVSILIIIVAFYFIARQYEVRMVLFIAGFTMLLMSGKFLVAFDKYLSTLLTGAIPQIIATACGYAYIMTYTKCDQHLAHWLIRYLKKFRFFMVPGAVIVSCLVTFALLSSASVIAAIGPVLIPVMVKAGIHPATAGAAILMGTWGNFFSVGSSLNAITANVAKVGVVEVIGHHFVAGIICLLVQAIVIAIVAKMRKEDRDYVDHQGLFVDEIPDLKVNYYKACLPFLPVFLVVLGIEGIELIPKLSVPQAMLLSSVWAMLTTRCNPKEAIKALNAGIGFGIGTVTSVIACAAVFTTGMQGVGLIDLVLKAMSNSTGIVAITSFIGPFGIALLSGSGDAAVLAFNGSVLPGVANMGLDPKSIGSLAFLSAGFGRSMSPVGSVAILAAALSRSSPIDLVKRSAPSCLIAGIVGFIILGYLV